jgi:hypothetical protein
MSLAGQPTDNQTTLIPWVQRIVIKHYNLGKEVFFWGQNNYVDLYRYLNDFLALYVMLSLGRTMGNDLKWYPVYHTYVASDRHPNTVFINREHADWGPAEQHSHFYQGFSVPTFTTDVLSHDYHL